MSDLTNKLHKVIIAGSGPAGLTAAIYASRANLEPVVVEGADDSLKMLGPGGQLGFTTDVENYPGFPEGIMGPALMAKFRAQAERFGTVFVQSDITKCDLSKRPFTLQTGNGETLRCETLIISTGASARYLGLESEQKLKGYGISACATCDGPMTRGKTVAVVGGGDTAIEEASHLTKYATKVTIIHRREELRASKIMRDRAAKNPKIEFKWNRVVEEVYDVEKNTVTGLKLRDVHTGEFEDFPVNYLFLAIGHTPNTSFLEGQIETDDHGFVKVKEPTTQTSVDGVFACGDVMDPTYKQAVTAAGTGCRAAIDVEKFLESQES